MLRFKIMADFNKAMAQVQQLMQIAQQMQSLVEGDLNGTLMQIGNSWTGENAQELLQKGNQIKSILSGSQQDVIRVATTFSNIATRLMEQERAAAIAMGVW